MKKRKVSHTVVPRTSIYLIFAVQLRTLIFITTVGTARHVSTGASFGTSLYPLNSLLSNCKFSTHKCFCKEPNRFRNAISICLMTFTRRVSVTQRNTIYRQHGIGVPIRQSQERYCTPKIVCCTHFFCCYDVFLDVLACPRFRIKE